MQRDLVIDIDGTIAVNDHGLPPHCSLELAKKIMTPEAVLQYEPTWLCEKLLPYQDRIIFLTARGNWIFSATKTWLQLQGFVNPRVITRRRSCRLPSADYKKPFIRALKPNLVLDDHYEVIKNHRHVAMLVSQDINTWKWIEEKIEQIGERK